MYSYGPLHMANQKQDDQLEHTYSSYVRIQDVALKTCQKRWMIGRSGERGSGISVLAARHDDDDDDFSRKKNAKLSNWIFQNNEISNNWRHFFDNSPRTGNLLRKQISKNKSTNQLEFLLMYFLNKLTNQIKNCNNVKKIRLNWMISEIMARKRNWEGIIGTIEWIN